jgi:glutamine synthetase
MPKPFADRTGSGLHLHLSLWSDGVSRFPQTADPRGLGLSPLAYAFVAGILDHASGLSALLAPSVNSYKRRGAASSESGATWAPTKATYGGNDRTHFIRVPDGQRVELRGGDGSANPYLAIAGALASGLAGIEAGADPGDPCRPGESRPTSVELPPTLLHAVQALRADPLLCETLSTPEHPVASYLAQAKEEEFLTWHNTVTDWELHRYLTAY